MDRSDRGGTHTEALGPLSEPVLRALLADAPFGFAVLDHELRYVAINDRLAAMNGVPVREHLGRRLRDVLPADVAGVAEPLFQRVMETGRPLHELEVSGEVPAGSGRVGHWLESAYPVPGLDGGTAALAVVVWEVTGRVVAERARAQTLALLDLLVQQAPIGMALFDRELRYVRINQTLAAANGLSAAEHLGRRMEEVLPHAAPDVVGLLRHVLDTGEALVDIDLETGETPARPGRRRYWRFTAYPVPDAGGGIIQGVGALVADDTDRYEAERERQRLHAAEQAAARRAEEAQRSVSNQLKDPVWNGVPGIVSHRGGVAWAWRWNPAPSAAPRGRWPAVGVLLIVVTFWCRWAARGSLRSVGACPSGRLPA